jgi:hypothetical protein
MVDDLSTERMAYAGVEMTSISEIGPAIWRKLTAAESRVHKREKAPKRLL